MKTNRNTSTVFYPVIIYVVIYKLTFIYNLILKFYSLMLFEHQFSAFNSW